MAISPEAVARREAARRSSGEFGEQQHSAPSVDAIRTMLDERIVSLGRAGYLPAATTADPFDPKNRSSIAQWWEHQFALAEQGKTSNYRVMPDDYTPGGASGRSMLRKRRTHRMLYEGAGVAMRMPSATAVRRFANELNGEPFDLPIEASYPGGSAQGYVRVQRGADGRWLTHAVGVDTSTPEGRRRYAYMSEAVSAVLEGRRPSLALGEVTDLMERRRERRQQVGERLQAPATESPAVRGVGYTAATRTMFVQLRSRVYAYTDIDPETFEKLRRSYTPGRFYNDTVKGRKPAQAAVSCEVCGNYFVASVQHHCRPQLRRADRARKFYRDLIRDAVSSSHEKAMRRLAQTQWRRGTELIPGVHRA